MYDNELDWFVKNTQLSSTELFENYRCLLLDQKLLRIRAKQHELLSSNDIYCQNISLVSEAKNQGSNTLKCKISILAMRHIFKKLLILLLSTLKFFDLILVLTKFLVSSLEKTVFKKVAWKKIKIYNKLT
jgi:hypothetical protein